MKICDDVDKETYAQFVKNSPYCNLFQSEKWGNIKKEWQTKRIVLIDDNHHILMAGQVLMRKGLCYMPRGPIGDYTNLEALETFIRELKQYARQQNAKLLKIDIPLERKNLPIKVFKQTAYPQNEQAILKIFKTQHFKHKGFSLEMSATIQPRFEAVVSLTDDLFKKLPSDTKNLIRRADKSFVTVKRMDKTQLGEFMKPIRCTEHKQGITLRQQDYFETLMTTYQDNCLVYGAYIHIGEALAKNHQQEQHIISQLQQLEHAPKKKKQLEEQLMSVQKTVAILNDIATDNTEDERIMASAMAIVYGHYAEMLYAGMDERFAKFYPQYKIYYETLLAAQQQGATTFSFGGVESTLDGNLLLFKSKFNPNIVEHYGEFDYVYSKIFAWLYHYGVPLRRKILSWLKYFRIK